MSAVVLLAVVSMLSSVFIAETTEGMATAINQSGSLRMRSYRIGVALADESVPARRRAERAATLAEELESRLLSPRLVNAIPGRPADEVTGAYERVMQRWEQEMWPPLAKHVQRLSGDAVMGSQALPRVAYLAGVDAFVAEFQVTRLAAALEHPDEGDQAKDVLAELRAGISSAYRQLRKLLTTFRLKLDDRGHDRGRPGNWPPTAGQVSVNVCGRPAVRPSTPDGSPWTNRCGSLGFPSQKD